MSKMRCTEFRQLTMTTRASERTEADCERLAAHALHCETCAEYAEQALRLEGLLGGIEPVTTSEDFTARVMAGVAELDAPPTASWYERVFGALRAPAPVLPVRQALATAALALLLVSGGLLVTQQRQTQDPAKPGTVIIADGNRQVEADEKFVQELICRHENARPLQPLSEDEGLRLVGY